MSILSSRYFKRMVALLLSVSLLPMLVLGVSFISLWLNSTNRSIAENGKQRALQISRQTDQLLARAAQLGQTSANQMIIKSVLSYLPGQVELATLSGAMDLMVLGDEQQLSLHVVGASHAFSTAELPEQFTYEAFSGTELFRSLYSTPRSSIIFSQPHTDDLGREAVISIVTPVCDYHDRLVGYTIVDIFQNAFRELVFRYGSNMDMALWYDGAIVLSTFETAVITPEQIQALPRYQAIDAFGGMAQADERFYYWNNAEYNRLSRVFCQNTDETAQMRANAFSLLAILMTVAGVLSALLAFWLSMHQSKPIIALHKAMDEVGQGDLTTQISIRGNNEIDDLGKRFNLLVAQLDASTKAKSAREAELRKQEITALQAQINPHFIYNSMGAARSLIRMGMPEQASEIIGQLSTLLHANLRNIDSLIPLRDDIALINSYMAIQNIRFHNRFTLLMDIPEELEDCLLPALILQPIVENAVKHGLEPMQGESRVQVTAAAEGEDLILTVEDNGVGISEEMEAQLNAGVSVGNHVGYLNVRRRLELYYGPEYTARIRRLPQGTCVTLRLPIRKEDAPCTKF